MRILMQEAENYSQLSLNEQIWDVAFVGKAVDDRGNEVIEFLRGRTTELYSLEYDPDEFELTTNGTRFNAEDLDSFLNNFKGKSIILETTTLGFVEIFLCCREALDLGFPKIQMVYVEPLSYNRPRRTKLLHKRDFELSDEVKGYRAIPGATFMLSDRSDQKGVFFLGYEESRLERALEDYQMIRPENCAVVFGVPAFNPGWEMDSFANNIRVIRDKNIKGGIHFCGAENPASALDVLNNVYKGLVENERLFVAPIGTKPSGIGVALFASSHRDVGVLYDHPKRSKGRSKEVSKWHLYDVEF